MTKGMTADNWADSFMCCGFHGRGSVGEGSEMVMWRCGQVVMKLSYKRGIYDNKYMTVQY